MTGRRPYGSKFRKPRECPGGCGTQVWNPGVCQDCRRLIRLGKDHNLWLERQQAFKRYSVGVAHIRTDTHARDRDNEAVRAILKTIADWLRTRQPEAYCNLDYPGSVELHDGRRVAEQINVQGELFGQDPRSIQCLLTEDEATFLKALYTNLKDIADDYYREGFEKGRSVLAGLADGTMTVEQANEWCRKYRKPEV